MQTEDFNPRSHKGSDTHLRETWTKEMISIHAPTRGATPSSISCCSKSIHFNPRSHKGSDAYTRFKSSESGDFNPRSHKGSDRNTFLLARVVKRFQSTLPQGERRLFTKPYAIQIRISIHAPTRGATSDDLLAKLTSGFQSTLPQGERLRK